MCYTENFYATMRTGSDANRILFAASTMNEACQTAFYEGV
jgi:hypothetical protein